MYKTQPHSLSKTGYLTKLAENSYFIAGSGLHA